MPYCDICGKEAYLLTALIEGSELSVCDECSVYGKVLKRPKPIFKEDKKVEEERMVDFVSGYGELVKRGREKLGLNQQEFAKRINERETIIQKIETEKIKPTIELARRLERFLGIKMIEELKKEDVKKEKRKEAGPFTFGDFIKS